MERRSLTKKTRFEVFKRDSFTCQYCGSKAPDVILEVDHIKPVRDGGDNDMMNLITSCFNCNRGKRDKKLSDQSIVEKQREQIKELNLRRQQLEMMLEWRDGLKFIKEEEYKKAVDYWNNKIDKYDEELSENGINEVKKLVRKYGVIDVLDAMDIAEDGYLKDGDSGNKAFNKIGAILYLRHAPEYKRKISYIKGICRNKFHYFNENRASIELNRLYEDGYNLDELKEDLCNDRFRNWSQFINFIESLYIENDD